MIILYGLTYPNVEIEVLVRHRFDVKSNGRYCCDYFADLRSCQSTLYARLEVPHALSFECIVAIFLAYLQPIQQGCLASIILHLSSESLHISLLPRSLTSPKMSILVSFFAQISDENFEI